MISQKRSGVWGTPRRFIRRRLFSLSLLPFFSPPPVFFRIFPAPAGALRRLLAVYGGVERCAAVCSEVGAVCNRMQQNVAVCGVRGTVSAERRGGFFCGKRAFPPLFFGLARVRLVRSHGDLGAFPPIFFGLARGGIPIVPLAARVSNRDWIVRFRAPALIAFRASPQGDSSFLNPAPRFNRL